MNNGAAAPLCFWRAGRHVIDLARPRVMGIVNATPDSFSDGGRDTAAAIAHLEQMVRDGADIVDIGGESTRPGSAPPGTEEELARVLPVVRHAVGLGVPVSVDTSDPQVMQAALDAGADIVNDVRALALPGALGVLAANATAGVCLMHMRGEPATMLGHAQYSDVVAEVVRELGLRLDAALDVGIASERIVLDPGIGFAKRAPHNLELLSRQRELLALGRPLMVGWSRKSTLGKVTGRGISERLPASVAAAVIALERGASILRVHDVAATVDAVALWCAARPALR